MSKYYLIKTNELPTKIIGSVSEYIFNIDTVAELTKEELEHIDGLGLTEPEYNRLQDKIRKVLNND